MTGYRLTFNKPAVAQLLQTDSGETADGLKIRIENGAAQFLPVRGSKDGDVIRLDNRSRGGVEATVEGSMAEDLAKALANDVGPFQTMHRAGQGWLGTQPHTKAEAPSKFIPHVRLWDNGAATTKVTKAPVRRARATGRKAVSATASSAPVAGNLSEMVNHLRHAKDTVSNYANGPHRGMPPREVREARQALAAFEQLAIEHLPEINEAAAILNRIIGRSGSNVDARVPMRKPQARRQPVAQASVDNDNASDATPAKAAPARRARKGKAATAKTTAKRRTTAKAKGGRGRKAAAPVAAPAEATA